MPNQFKEGREKCYCARDKYWKCLDSNNEDTEKCRKLRTDFEKLCSNQWVKYFERQRKFNKFKAEADLSNWERPLQEVKSKASN